MEEVRDTVIAYPFEELIFNKLPGTNEAYAELELQNISTTNKVAFKIDSPLDLYEVAPRQGVIDIDSSVKIAINFKSTSVSML